jgi:hypothetical protein
MNLSNFLLFCSGVSKKVLQKCPETEAIKHTSIGASVLFTAILAMVSSHFAFSLIFQSSVTVFFLSFFWGLILFNLDRYIISTLRKKGNFFLEFLQISPRLVLSIAIALVIAKPLELQIFKSEIDQVLYVELKENVSILENEYQQKILNADAEKKQLNQELRGYFELKEKYYQEYRCECDGTCGTGKAGDGKECTRKKIKYDDFNQEYQSKEASIGAALILIEQNKKAYTQNFEDEKETLKSNFSYGLLARIKALNGLGGWETWTVTFLILLIEIAPVLTKLATAKGPYDELLALEENNFKANYVKNFYQSGKRVVQEEEYKLQETSLMKKESQFQKQKMVKELYQDLRQELSKQLNK